ncbi:hypothetical protein A4A49_65563, partial [Nicotiana attenuata]
KRRRLTQAELNEKRAQGLCFLCDKKFHPGHVCKNKAQVYMPKLVEEVELIEQLGEGSPNEDEIAETCEISIHALQGTQGYQTIRFMGYSRRKPLNILIDSGSTHNFMDSGLVARMCWRVDPCKVLDANLDDGNSVP